MKKVAAHRRWILNVFPLFLVQLYSPLAAPAQPKSAQIVKPIHSIAVMPFIKGRDANSPKDTLDCVISQLFWDPEKLLAESDHKMTVYAYEELSRRYGARMASPSDVNAAYESMPKNENRDTLRTLAMRLAQVVKADAVVAGNIWRYRKRRIDSEGTEVPASVSFAVYLIESESGKVLWRGSFEESQQKPSEEMLDIRAMLKSKGKWLSADELARRGVKKAFKGLPI
jgi:hypothetical protein